MALTPHINDPNRGKVLRKIAALTKKGGPDAASQLKEEYNMDAEKVNAEQTEANAKKADEALAKKADEEKSGKPEAASGSKK